MCRAGYCLARSYPLGHRRNISAAPDCRIYFLKLSSIGISCILNLHAIWLKLFTAKRYHGRICRQTDSIFFFIYCPDYSIVNAEVIMLYTVLRTASPAIVPVPGSNIDAVAKIAVSTAQLSPIQNYFSLKCNYLLAKLYFSQIIAPKNIRMRT